MEIGYILNQLWRRRLWVALGVVVAVCGALTTAYEIPSFETKSYELGAASTEVLVDAPRSPLGALDTDVTTLVTRAQVYARLMESEPVKDQISRELGIPRGSLATRGPQPGVEKPGAKSNPASRAAELLTEGSNSRLFASASVEIPIVSISTQATTAEGAIRLADAAARALATYISEIQVNQSIAPNVRTQIRQLGAARGGVVNKGVSKVAAALTFFGVLGFWCIAILLTVRLGASWRAARSEGDRDPSTEPSGVRTNGSAVDAREAAGARALAAKAVAEKPTGSPKAKPRR